MNLRKKRTFEPHIKFLTKMEQRNNRILPMLGAYNVRDLGGYTSGNNKTIRWNTLFRSGDLNNLTEEDLDFLSAIPIQTTIDFREEAEISVSPDQVIPSVKNQYFFPIKTGSIIEFQKITPELAPTILIDANRSFVINNQDVYSRFFEILMQEENLPILFHCSAGKDRAGFAAVLFLSSLGVDRTVILQDYLLTNDCLRDKYAAIIEAIPMVAPLMEARKEYIQAAFDEIDNNYGGIENYLTQYLKVDLEKMRSIYCENGLSS